MIPPDDDACKPAPGCEVDLKTMAIRFSGCEGDKATIGLVEERLAAVTRQLGARSGLTNRERRELSREANILRRWLFPDDKRSVNQRGVRARLINRRRRALSVNASGEKSRKPSKRECREARRHYREQHAPQKRPDYHTPVMMTEKERQELIKRRDKKLIWFNRGHRDGLSQPTSLGCAETTQVITLSEGDKLA
jgi:hypothetical protein